MGPRAGLVLLALVHVATLVALTVGAAVSSGEWRAPVYNVVPASGAAPNTTRSVAPSLMGMMFAAEGASVVASVLAAINCNDAVVPWLPAYLDHLTEMADLYQTAGYSLGAPLLTLVWAGLSGVGCVDTWVLLFVLQAAVIWLGAAGSNASADDDRARSGRLLVMAAAVAQATILGVLAAALARLPGVPGFVFLIFACLCLFYAGFAVPAVLREWGKLTRHRAALATALVDAVCKPSLAAFLWAGTRARAGAANTSAVYGVTGLVAVLSGLAVVVYRRVELPSDPIRPRAVSLH